jgi:dipeptidyl aminopeptidase/acylaminoacyl peptidase
VRFVRYPREKHGFEERAHQIDLMQRIIDWFEQHLRG